MTDDKPSTSTSPRDSADTTGVNTSNHVYVRSSSYAWIPSRLLESDGVTATVSTVCVSDEQGIGIADPPSGPKQRKTTLETIQLKDYPASSLPLQNVDAEGRLRTVPDMVDLPFLHEAAILYNLKWRHVHSKPYTRTGDIIIAVNPYCWLNHLYSEEIRCFYAEKLVWNSNSSESAAEHAALDPHVYETSSLAYRGLCLHGEDQSILVSGESGAGKTETVKILLTDIASVQRGGYDSVEHACSSEKTSSSISTYHSPIVQRVLDSNPLLEAFGNAKTVRNDNSSRFGKYIQLQFDVEDPVHAAYRGRTLPSAVLAGSRCEVYLLEKSRVVHHETAERTYHIFYQLLAAPNEVKVAIWEGLADTDQESFAYVGYTETDTIEGLTDGSRFELTIQSLALIGVVDDPLQTLLRAICIVLQLGNLVFAEDESDETKSVIESEEEFVALANLMGVPESLLAASLTVRTVSARNEVFKVPLSAVAAKDSCDAFAKEIYAKAFLWLVRTINDATRAENNYTKSDNTGEYGTIGLLDIFGFESFETNRFEQLCINYANEKLQQKFTQDVFRSVQAEYEFEGIELGEITYDDNTDVLDLVEGRMGLIAFLNEECVRPGGSDKGFVSKAAAMNKDNSCFIREKSFTECQFGVNHYAGRVIYDATCFVTKNMDTLPTDLQECATQSSNAILANELTNDAAMNPIAAKGTPAGKVRRKAPPATPQSTPGKRNKGNLVGETVWTKFRNQLSSLMVNLKKTRTRYIRCIKPNTMKQPLIMQHMSTVEQLRCAGVVAAVTISRSAFPNRLEHEIVLDRFKALWPKGDHVRAEKETLVNAGHEEPLIGVVDALLTSALQSMQAEKEGSIVKAFVLGKTRTYFRAGALEYVENERVKCLSRWAVEIQRVGRRYVARSRYTLVRSSVVRMESFIRMMLVRRLFMRNHSAIVKIECWYRCVCAQRMLVRLRRNHMATMLQTHWRMAMAVTRLKSCRRATIAVQKIVRGALQRPRYRVALLERKEEAKLENQVLALQRKLEEAERRHVEAEKRAEEKARQAIQEQNDTAHSTVQMKPDEEKKEDDKTTAVQSDTSSLTNPDEQPTPSPGQLSAQQQKLMDESGKMLEYLRKEVFKLRSHNAQMRSDFDLLKDNNQRLMDANASAGASFAALNQHAKQLSRANEKLTTDMQSYKQQVQKLSVTQVELKEELKMKQATYVAEVHSRLQYQKALSKIIDVAQERCRDDRLVEEFLRIADACEAEYMSGPTGLNASHSSFFTPSRASGGGKPAASDSGVLSSIRKMWS